MLRSAYESYKHRGASPASVFQVLGLHAKVCIRAKEASSLGPTGAGVRTHAERENKRGREREIKEAEEEKEERRCCGVWRAS